MKRTRTISVRVSEAEWTVWEAVREASGRAEMGAWVRAVVADVLEGGTGQGRAPGRPGDVPRVPEVNAEAYAHLVAAGNNLNQLTRYAHQSEGLAGDVGAAIAEVVAAARAVRGLGANRGTGTSRPDRPARSAPAGSPPAGSVRPGSPPAGSAGGEGG